MPPALVSHLGNLCFPSLWLCSKGKALLPREGLLLGMFPLSPVRGGPLSCRVPVPRSQQVGEWVTTPAGGHGAATHGKWEGMFGNQVS